MSLPTTPPLSGVLDAPLVLPEASRRVLGNGLEVLAIRYSRLPVVALRLVSRAGRWTEAPDERGLSGMSALLASHGTALWSSAEMALLQDARGLRMGASASLDDRVVSVRALAEELPLAVEVLAQLTRFASFPQSHLDREVETAVQSLRHRRSSPDAITSERLASLLHPGHPYGDPAASEEELRALTPDRLRAWQDRRVGPDSALVVAVGDLHPEALLDQVQASFSDWSASALPESPEPATPAPVGDLLLVDRPASEQATIALGLPAPPRVDPRWAAVRLLASVLGGGGSSRLFLELRERRGLTYGGFCGYDAGQYGGDVTIGLSCSASKVEEALGAVNEEMERLRREPVSEAELELARRGLLGGLPMAAASLGGLASLFGTRWLFDLEPDAWAKLGDQLAAIGPGELMEAAQTWLDPALAHRVVVGQAELLEAACAVHGPVRVERVPTA